MTGVSYGGAVSYNAIFTKRYDTDYSGSTPLVITRTTINGGNSATSVLLTDQFNIGDADLIGIELVSVSACTIAVSLFDEYIVGSPLYTPPRVFLRPLGKITVTTVNNGSYGRTQAYFRRPNSPVAGNFFNVATPALADMAGIIPVTPSGKPTHVNGATGVTYSATNCPLPAKVYFCVQNVDTVNDFALSEYSILVIR